MFGALGRGGCSKSRRQHEQRHYDASRRRQREEQARSVGRAQGRSLKAQCRMDLGKQSALMPTVVVKMNCAPTGRQNHQPIHEGAEMNTDYSIIKNKSLQGQMNSCYKV